MADNNDALLAETNPLEDRRYDAMVRGDLATLAAVFDDGLIYTHSSGVRQDAAEYLRGLQAGTDVYRNVEHGIDQVARLADGVLVYGWQRMTVVSGGATRKLDILSLMVLSRPGGRAADGCWRLCFHRARPRCEARSRGRLRRHTNLAQPYSLRWFRLARGPVPCGLVFRCECP